MTIISKFDHGQMVYLKHDPDQNPRMVVSIKSFPGDMLMYDLVAGKDESTHYEMEISPERDVLLATTN